MQTCTEQVPSELCCFSRDEEQRERDPEHVASLLIISLFTSFLFSNSASTITWDPINVACNVYELKKFNWSAIVLCFLEERLKKYDKEKLVTISSCLLLILYWFLENTNTKWCIQGRESDSPTFTRWSIQRIFDLETFKHILNIAEATQETKEEAEQVATNLKEVINQLEESMADKKEHKKWEELGQFLKRLQEQNQKLWNNCADAEKKIQELAKEEQRSAEHSEKTGKQSNALGSKGRSYILSPHRR
ncbi:hypothetical protein M0R45_025958 [Rubus argutus]|uniref:Uncharacterized protein n=1 Tax=Rubus argutus TaxID=59490 RepID=A0AAW1WVZ7_RUBAR